MACEMLKNCERNIPLFKNDLGQLIEQLQDEPHQGEPLGKDCFKIRLAITSKNRGKRSGARVITCVKIVDETVYLIAIDDKREVSNTTNGDLADRILNIP